MIAGGNRKPRYGFGDIVMLTACHGPAEAANLTVPTERVLTNAAVEEIQAIQRDKRTVTTIDDIRHLVGRAGNCRVLQDGEMDAGAWSCGMVAGLIHDIPTCKELIDRIMAEAEAIISSRLEALLAT